MLRTTAVALLALLPLQDPPPRSQPQEPTPAQQQPAPKAEAKDVASVDSIVAALYDVISGPAGQKRDWARMQGLFHADAKLVPIVKTQAGMQARHLTVADYVRRSGPFLEQNGFFEQEIARRADAFGDLAHVWSTYAARKVKDDAEPFLRGINSIQLVRQQGRWWILQVAWEQEADAGPIPAAYLPK